jgi:hypothetical protein
VRLRPALPPGFVVRAKGGEPPQEVPEVIPDAHRHRLRLPSVNNTTSSSTQSLCGPWIQHLHLHVSKVTLIVRNDRQIVVKRRRRYQAING